MSQEEPPTSSSPSHCLRAKDWQPLVPLRVDVSLPVTSASSSSATPRLRIVETLLLDPSVWPVRKQASHGNDDNAWIAANALYLAQGLLTDLEVQGMGRNQRHFTNRAELWSLELQQQVVQQLEDQLRVVAAMQPPQRKRRPPSTQEPTENAKHPRMSPKETSKPQAATAESSPMPTTPVKQESLEPTETTKSTTEIPTEDAPAPGQPDTSSSTVPPQENTSTAATATADVTTNTTTARKAAEPSSSSLSSHLIPIHIRLSVHGVRIHDDCWWDPDLSSQVTPLQYAQSLGHDLKLSPEAIQAVTVDITEQLYGSPRNADALPAAHVPVVDEGSVVRPPYTDASTTAAWSLDARTHISHVAHLVAQSRTA